MSELPLNIRVVIADDHSVFRAGVEGLLASQPDIDVVGQAGDGFEATRVALALRPDVVLMDVQMPVRNGIDATRDIHESAPDIKVLMLSGSDEEADLYGAIKAGAAGYLLKIVEGDELLAAIRAGKTYANVHSTKFPGGEIRAQLGGRGGKKGDN